MKSLTKCIIIKIYFTANFDQTNCLSKKGVNMVWAFIMQMFNVKTLFVVIFIFEILTAFDLFYCGQTKQGTETTSLIIAPFIVKVSGQLKAGV